MAPSGVLLPLLSMFPVLDRKRLFRPSRIPRLLGHCWCRLNRVPDRNDTNNGPTERGIRNGWIDACGQEQVHAKERA